MPLRWERAASGHGSENPLGLPGNGGRDSRDRRVVWVILTDEGEQLVERIPSFFEHLGKAFTVLPARELEQMRESLRRVLAADDDEGKR